MSEAKDTIPEVSSFDRKQALETDQLIYGGKQQRDEFIKYWATTLWPQSMTPQSIQKFKELQRVAMFDMPAKEFEALSKAKKSAIEKARKEVARRENERTQSL